MDTLNLYCIPYSGSSATIFYKWRARLPSQIRVVALELAGRGSRMREAPYDSVPEAVHDLHALLKRSHNNGPYAIFGHSLGGLLAFELAHTLLDNNELPPPSHMFFSGCRPPQDRPEEEMIHALPDQEFMKRIFALGGTSVSLVDNVQLLKLFLPIIRADYRIYETYVYSDRRRPFDCPITVMTGDRDTLVLPKSPEGWRIHTTKTCNEIVFKDAGHFFIEDKLDDSIQAVVHALCETALPCERAAVRDEVCNQ